MELQNSSIRQAAQALSSAKRVVVFSGAGMSAESGILTFRDPEVGIWKNRFALFMFGTPLGWRWTPGWAWSYYLKFHDPIFRAMPNDGHRAVADMERVLQLRGNTGSVQIVTQNVDYLHQRAGSPPDTVYEVHGTIFRHRCIKSGHPILIPQDEPLPRKQPSCTVCGSKARPDATLFRENLPSEAWENAERAIKGLQRGDVLLITGTSGSVYPAAGLPTLARDGVVKIEVNCDRSGHTNSVDIFVQSGAAVALPEILRQAAALKFSS